MTDHIPNKLKNHLLILDGHALAFNSWFRNDPPDAVSGFFEMLEEAIENYNPTYLISTFDPAPPTFRHKLYPEYKANRPPVPEGFLEDCQRVRAILKREQITSCTVEGYEADDVIATLATKATNSGFFTTIVTSDLDLLQLVNNLTEVEIFSQYRSARLFDIKGVHKRFNGLEPKNIPDYKALVGDKSDNLPGVPGIGDVSATAILSQAPSLEDIYEDLFFIEKLPIRGAKRVRKILEENQAHAFFMRTLTTVVCDVPFKIDFKECIFEKSEVVSFV